MWAKAKKNFLLFLTELNLKQLKSLSRHFSPQQKKALREIALNLLKNNINVTDEDKKLLSKHKGFIRLLARKSLKACMLSRYCRGLLTLLKIVKSTIEEL